MTTESPVIDAEVQSTAVAVREQHAVPALAREVAPLTPQQAKVDAVANLTFKAYERASTLQLSETELKALQEDFPDNAFRLGAGGDANLIYIEHAHLRDRLNKVFGPGQWSIIPRNRWNEEYKTGKGEQAIRVYVEAMLLVRGCFVAEAVGDMSYYPGNSKTNYGDAVEGAKSACLRRCAKELGVGLQAWKKDFSEGWKQRQQRGPVTYPQRPPVAQPAPETRKDPTAGDEIPMGDSKPPTPKVDAKPKKATAETRKWMLEQLASLGEERVLAFARAEKIILPSVETLKDWPLDKVVTSKEALKELVAKIEAFKPAPDKAPEAADTRLKVVGQIEKVEVKNSPAGAKKPWTLYVITMVGGESLTTFSKTLAGECESSGSLKETVTLFYEEKDGKKTALEILAPFTP